LRGDKNGFVDTSKLFRRPQNEQHKAPSPLAPGGGFCWASGTMTGGGASFAGRLAVMPSARAFPPFLPNATAAGSLPALLAWVAVRLFPVGLLSMIDLASWLGSLGRLGGHLMPFSFSC
jgi:hypothetical protein